MFHDNTQISQTPCDRSELFSRVSTDCLDQQQIITLHPPRIWSVPSLHRPAGNFWTALPYPYQPRAPSPAADHTSKDVHFRTTPQKKRMLIILTIKILWMYTHACSMCVYEMSVYKSYNCVLFLSFLWDTDVLYSDHSSESNLRCLWIHQPSIVPRNPRVRTYVVERSVVRESNRIL